MGGPGSFNGTGNPNWRDKNGKGISGNPYGRPPAKESLTELLAEFGEKMRQDPKNKRLKATCKRLLAGKIWDMAVEKGDAGAIKQIFDRIEGPVANVNLNYNQQAEKETLEYREFIRADLIRIKQYVHPWYKPAFYHRELGRILQDENELKVIIVIPPQHGKSEIVTKTFPAVFLANNSDKTIILGSYNDTYAEELSVKSRDFFLNDKFQMLFDNKYEMHPDQQTKHKWAIKGYEGSAIFAGVGGAITGNPSDVFVVDDLDKDFEDACSKVKQEKKWNWFKSVVDTRMRNEKSRQIIITTRFVKNDLVGHLQNYEEENNIPAEKRFKIYHFPAILDVVNDEYAKGRPLWPEVKNMEFLLERQRKDPAMFKAIWMGNPRDLEGRVIKPEWIRYEDDIKSLGKLIGSVRGWDFGYTESGDETVGAKVDAYEDGEKITCILSSVVRCRKDPAGVKELVVQTAQADGSDVIVGVESGGTQIAMANAIAQRKELADYRVRSVVPRGEKIARAMPWILKLEDSMFRLAKGTWNQEAVRSLVDFEDGCEHDDLEDAITTAWKTLWGGR